MNLHLRRQIIKRIRLSCEQVRGRRYFVHRGALVWAVFPFDIRKFGLSIVINESDVITKPSVMTVTLEMATKMVGPGDLPGLDDNVLEEMLEDSQQILTELFAAEVEGVPGERLVQKIPTKDERRPQAIEFSHDAVLIQGLMTVFEVGF